jgi:hypothetical protein
MRVCKSEEFSQKSVHSDVLEKKKRKKVCKSEEFSQKSVHSDVLREEILERDS